MTLVDTSSWINFLRRDGERRAKERVRSLLNDGSAALCAVVLTELWMGAGSAKDQEDVAKIQSVLPCLAVGQAVWDCAYRLAKACRREGTPVPSSDAVIAACAFVHGAKLESSDKHFQILERFRAEVMGDG